MMYGNSVVLSIQMLIRLLCAVANARATNIFAVSSNCGSGCTAPVTSFVLVVVTYAVTGVVCCGFSVGIIEATFWSGLGFQFYIPSVIANVISMCGKLIVPLAVSIAAWCFLMELSPILGKDVFERITRCR